MDNLGQAIKINGNLVGRRFNNTTNGIHGIRLYSNGEFTIKYLASMFELRLREPNYGFSSNLRWARFDIKAANNIIGGTGKNTRYTKIVYPSPLILGNSTNRYSISYKNGKWCDRWLDAKGNILEMKK